MKQQLIPGWMAEEDLEIIAELAKQVPQDGLIIEVGSWMGQSTQAWSMNTCAKVYAIDLWKWMPKEYKGPAKDAVNLKGDPYAQFLAFTRHLTNVIPMRRESSGGDWELGMADIVFIDAMHQNPWVANDIAYWEPKVKSGGIICGDDYSPAFPAVVEESKKLADRLGVPLETPGRKFWIVRKP
ncbi:MAG: class I SAM-dependent methyltransferase [Roseovarius sp.]|nr:class I SAM-dependent methyltransferase [Roseovarius sp.]